jgi:hypothetical protein
VTVAGAGVVVLSGRPRAAPADPTRLQSIASSLVAGLSFLLLGLGVAWGGVLGPLTLMAQREYCGNEIYPEPCAGPAAVVGPAAMLITMSAGGFVMARALRNGRRRAEHSSPPD